MAAVKKRRKSVFSRSGCVCFRLCIMQVERIAWDSQAEKKLESALMDDSIQIKYEVENRIAELWLIDKVSYLVTRVEHSADNKRELVLVAGAGKNAAAVIEYFKNKAKENSINSIRLHSNKKGMKRLIEKTGLKPIETVYRTVF